MSVYSTAQYIGFGVIFMLGAMVFVVIGMLAYYKASFLQMHAYLFEEPSRKP